MVKDWISAKTPEYSTTLISEDERVAIMNKFLAVDPEFREVVFTSFRAWWIRNVLNPVSDRVEEALESVESIEHSEDREEIARELTLRIVSASDLADIEEAMYKFSLDPE